MPTPVAATNAESSFQSIAFFNISNPRDACCGFGFFVVHYRNLKRLLSL